MRSLFSTHSRYEMNYMIVYSGETFLNMAECEQMETYLASNSVCL